MIFGGVFSKIKAGLAKTRSAFSGALKRVLKGRTLSDETLEELEELMISWDMGVAFATRTIERLSARFKSREFQEEEVVNFLKSEIKGMLSAEGVELNSAPSGPTVVLVCGVNGAGKTTSIAKLANLLHKEGNKVLLAAGDTFRAAAVQQLTIWSERIGIEIVKHDTGADPAAVCFDAIEAGLARKADIILIDTAGRLHTQVNLMKELEKIKRVIQKKIPDAPHEVLLVIDATTGQNGIQQAKKFNEAVTITGLVLAKLDGTAKGGVTVSIKEELGVPVKFIGLGEGIDDIAHFNPAAFTDALFEE